MTNPEKQAWSKAGYYSACVLVIISLGAALGHYILPAALHVRLFAPLYGEEYTSQQFQELSKTPINEALHRLGGSLYMILGLLQFSPRFRKKNWLWHRRLGRIFLLVSFPVGISGVVWGIMVPFGGFPEAVPTLFFCLIFLYAAGKAYLHARQRNFQAHKEWILRCFHLGLGIASIRIVFLVMSNLLTIPDRELLPITFWLTWSTHLIIAEWWIQSTRPKVRSKAMPA